MDSFSQSRSKENQHFFSPQPVNDSGKQLLTSLHCKINVVLLHRENKHKSKSMQNGNDPSTSEQATLHQSHISELNRNLGGPHYEHFRPHYSMACYLNESRKIWQ